MLFPDLEQSYDDHGSEIHVDEWHVLPIVHCAL
jgi:hypothetical protein